MQTFLTVILNRPVVLVVILLAGLAAALWLLERGKPTGFEYREASNSGAIGLIVGIGLGVVLAIAFSIITGKPV